MSGPVLFLDIDGTIRPHGSRPSDGAWAAEYDGVCPDRVALLNRLAAVPGLSVVVSSTWRRDASTPAALARQGLALPFHEDWRTTLDVPSPGTPVRGWQVARWLGGRRVPYAILDDEDEFLPRQRRRLVLTDPFRGVEAGHVSRLASLLDASLNP